MPRMIATLLDSRVLWFLARLLLAVVFLSSGLAKLLAWDNSVAEMQAAFGRVFSASGREALQYSTTEGYKPLREWVARHVSTPEAPVSPDEVLMVSGSQQGLDLLAKALINPGDKVLVETPTYLGALQAFSMFSPSFTGTTIIITNYLMCMFLFFLSDCKNRQSF